MSERSSQDADHRSIPPAMQSAVASAACAITAVVAGVLVLLTVNAYPVVAQRAPRLVAMVTVGAAGIILVRDMIDLSATGGLRRLDPRPLLRSRSFRLRTGVVLLFAVQAALIRRVHFLPVAFSTLLIAFWTLGWRRPVWRPVLSSLLIAVVLHWAFTGIFRVRL